MKTNKRMIVIMGIIIVITIVIGGGIVLLNKNKKEGTINKNEQSIGKHNSFKIEDFAEKNEGVYITNYVDTVNGFYFKYPVYIDLSKYSNTKEISEKNVLVSRQSGVDRIEYKTTIRNDITSILGNIKVNIYEGTNLLKKGWRGITDYGNDIAGENYEIKQVDQFNNNQIEWKKYNIVLENGNKCLLYMFEKNELTYIVYFGLLNGESLKNYKLKDMTDELWKDVVKNKEKISEGIVKSFTFTDDLEYMLNLKEASILYFNTKAYQESLIVRDMDTKQSTEKTIRLPELMLAKGNVFVKNDKINIENAMQHFITTFYSGTDFNPKLCTYTIRQESEIMTIKNSDKKEYKVKYYEVEEVSKDPKYAERKDTIRAYIFETEEYIGFLSTEGKSYEYKSVLDFSVKNLCFKKSEEVFVDITKFLN